MKKYKVELVFVETVEAENEDDAKLIAYDNVFASSYSEADVEEIKPQANERNKNEKDIRRLQQR